MVTDKRTTFLCRERGFTLLEILLVLALITIILGITIPTWRVYYLNNDLRIAGENVVASLYRAEILSQSKQHNGTWGVYILDDIMTIFQGDSYADRNTNRDETIALPPTITVSGDNEIIFEELSGFPDTSSSLTLTNTVNKNATITINEIGVITISYDS